LFRSNFEIGGVTLPAIRTIRTVHYPKDPAVPVMNIEWDYNYYQPWSDNEWLVDKMMAMLDEDIIMQ